MDVPRNHDASGRRFRLQARGYIHAIAIEIVAIHDQVAEMQADPKHDGGVVGLTLVGLGHGLLELDGRAQCVDGTGELDQGPVARQLDQAAAVAGQGWPKAVGAMGLQPGKGAVLITTHQARIANDIRRQNCRQSPYNPLAGHQAPKAVAILLEDSPKHPGWLHLRQDAWRCRPCSGVLGQGVLADRAGALAPDQGRRHRTCQQDCADGLGHDGKG